MCSTEDDIHEEIHIILSVTSIRTIMSLQWGVKLSKLRKVKKIYNF